MNFGWPRFIQLLCPVTETEETILIQADPEQQIAHFLAARSFSRLGVLTDANTFKACYPKISHGLPPHASFTVAAGEESKHLDTCSQIWKWMTTEEFDRHSLLVVLGGGVLGDMGGFCAATFKRGIPFVLMPTTLLAQVDASVGGKLGIDFGGYKNHIGVIQQPMATLIAPAFLDTLPEAELRSGFAEIIKHSLLMGQEEWDRVRAKTLIQHNWQERITASVAFKKSITTQDPQESGLRKILNLGHTLGHALESASFHSPKRLLHGEAVAAGLVVESHIAMTKGLLNRPAFEQIEHYISGIFGRPGQHIPIDHIVANARQDKKNRGNKILMALLKNIGEPLWDVEVSEEEIRLSWRVYTSGQM